MLRWAAFYRRSAVEKLFACDGFFFDPDFFIYYEDFDVAFRLQMNGWKSLYVADATVFHKKGGSPIISAKSLFLTHRNNVFVIAKNLPNEFIIKNIFFIVFAECAAIIFNFIRRGWKMGYVVLCAKREGIRKWEIMRKKGEPTRNSTKDWKNIEKLFVFKWTANSFKR